MTIIPRGRALGVTMQLPEGDRHTHTREFLEAQIAILMGGRVAEELFLRQMTSGAGNDIERATDIARRMVCEFGMSRARAAGVPHARQPVGNRPRRRHQRGDGAARGRGSPRAGDARLRDRAPARREATAASVRAMAEELLVVESLDADGIKAVIARAA